MRHGELRNIIETGVADASRQFSKQRKTVHNGVSDPGGKPPDPRYNRRKSCVHIVDMAERRKVDMKMSREKHLRLSDEEFHTLQERAAAACMSDSAYIRRLIMDKPPVIIDDRFYAAMEIIPEFSDKIDEVAMKTDNSVDMIAVMTEARKWRAFQNAIEKAFLRPKRGDD